MEMLHEVETETGPVDSNALRRSAEAFAVYKKMPGKRRAGLLLSIAEQLEALRSELVSAAKEETHLPEARLNGELTRTTGQLRAFAACVDEGSWVEAVIDRANAARVPPKPDTRKMLLPLGPVVVFGASNFPFAFSTAGGDTASALAAGVSVVVKAHPAHPRTSELAFSAIRRALKAADLPADTVQHIAGGNEVGKALVLHPDTCAVGFTGSFAGGTALVHYAQARKLPIPVFAEMSSVNPVVFYPDALAARDPALPVRIAGSIVLGAGQFCTNPGLLLGLAGEDFNLFLDALAAEIGKSALQTMLHAGIFSAYRTGVSAVTGQPGVNLLTQSGAPGSGEQAVPAVAKVTGADFLANPALAQEVFGPWSLAVVCADPEELVQCLRSLHGQLTTTLIATARDVADFSEAIECQRSLAGRILLNDVPTGVEVCASMVHGGPYPATTDARFTSVGLGAIRRWVRPVCFQNFTDDMLPDELKNGNPSGILRIVDNEYTRGAVV